MAAVAAAAGGRPEACCGRRCCSRSRRSRSSCCASTSASSSCESPKQRGVVTTEQCGVSPAERQQYTHCLGRAGYLLRKQLNSPGSAARWHAGSAAGRSAAVAACAASGWQAAGREDRAGSVFEPQRSQQSLDVTSRVMGGSTQTACTTSTSCLAACPPTVWHWCTCPHSLTPSTSSSWPRRCTPWLRVSST